LPKPRRPAAGKRHALLKVIRRQAIKVHIQQGKAEMQPGREEAILERVHFTLARLSHRIQTLRIRLDDLNGPRGGVDKRCIMEALLVHRGHLVVDVSDADLLVAVSRAARRLARRVADEFERSRDLRRNGSDGIPTAPERK
jgi:putative sigma-54 modulation protein